MEYCSNCGQKIKEGIRFCPFCGADLCTADNQRGMTANSYDPAVSQNSAAERAYDPAVNGNDIAACRSEFAADEDSTDADQSAADGSGNAAFARNTLLHELQKARQYFSQYQNLYDQYFAYLGPGIRKLVRKNFFLYMGLALSLYLSVLSIVKVIDCSTHPNWKGEWESPVPYIFAALLFIAITVGVIYYLVRRAKTRKIKRQENARMIVAADRKLMKVYEDYPGNLKIDMPFTLPQLIDELAYEVQAGLAMSVIEAQNNVRRRLIALYRGTPKGTLHYACLARVNDYLWKNIVDPATGSCAVHFVLPRVVPEGGACHREKSVNEVDYQSRQNFAEYSSFFNGGQNA